MGFFSNRCSKTGMPVMAERQGDTDADSEVVVLFENGDRFRGTYDGYGCVECRDVHDDLSSGRAKWVLEKYYDGEKFEELPRSRNCRYQGYFFGDRDLVDLKVAWETGGLDAVDALYDRLQKR